MEHIDLTGLQAPITNVRHIVNCAPAAEVTRDEATLKRLRSGRKSRYGVAQSEHSKHRQNFMVGMETQRLGPSVMRARSAYLEEWHDRMRNSL